MSKDKEDSWKNKRQFYRLDTFSPVEISLVPPENRDKLECKEGGEYELKPRIINISGGGMSLRTTEKFNKDDIVEIILSLMSITICVYGKVLKVDTTIAGNYHIYIQYLDMPERVRERIISFVFHSEREILRNNLLSTNYRFSTVPVKKLVLGTFIPAEIFVKEEKSIKFLFGAGIFYDSAAKEFLEEKKITTLFINDEEMPLIENYLERYRKRQAPKAAMSFKDYSFHKSNYLRVDKRLLITGEAFTFNTFFMRDFTFYSIEDAVQAQPGSSKIDIISDEKNILIKRSELRLYKEYLDGLQSSKKIPDVMLPVILKERACILVAEILSDPGNKENIQKAFTVIDDLIDCLMKNPDSIYKILYLNSGDFYVYIHSVHVAAMCLRMGVELKMAVNNLRELGIGALLHDIGYSVISDDIINKMGNISINEYEVLKTHVVEGGKILRSHGVIPLRAFEVVLQHHEWMSGRAYPFNLPENKISLFGRLTSICDSYDILTTSKFYRKPLTSLEALSVIQKEARNKQDSDAEIVQGLFNILSRLKQEH